MGTPSGVIPRTCAAADVPTPPAGHAFLFFDSADGDLPKYRTDDGVLHLLGNDATLAALASQDWVLNAVPVGTGADTVAQLALPANTLLGRSSTGDVAAKAVTDFAFSMLDDTNAAAVRATLGLGTAATGSTGDFDPAGAASAAQAASQPLDSDLTAIAALTTTSFGRALLALANAAAGRTAFGLGSAATASTSDFDPAGAAASAAAAAQAASQPLDNDLTAIAALTTTIYGRAFLALADAAAARSVLALGTAATSNTGDFDATGAAAAAQAASQPLDSDLTAIAALSTTSFGRSLLALANAAAGRTAFGLGTAATSNTTDFDAAGAASAAVAAHEAASDPHPQYMTAAETSSAFQPLDSDLTAIAALSTTSYGRALLTLADAAAARTALALGSAALNSTGDFDAAGAAAAAQTAAQSYADSLVVGLWDDRGNYDASGNTYPASGGSGSAGAVKKGDIWRVSVAGTLNSKTVAVGDTLRALIDTPGQTNANWAQGEDNLGYVPLNAALNLSDLLSAVAARGYLGSTTVGDALFVAVSAAAARTTLGLGTAATNNTGDFDAAGAAAAVQAASQPLDSDLTAIAALTTTSFGRAFLTLANAAAARAAIGSTTVGDALFIAASAAAARSTLGLGSAALNNTGDFDAAGAAAAAQAASQPLDSDLTALAALSTTSYGRSLLELANAAALRTAAGSVIGTDVQAYSAVLDLVAALAANKFVARSSSGVAAAKDISDVALTLVAQTTQALMRTTGLGMSANGSSLVSASDYSAMRTLLSLVPGTNIPSGSGTSTGTNTGDQTSVTGNAGTATALQTARNIDGQSFDGTASITVVAPGTHAATSKATPVDADEVPLVDSAASNVLKKLTWANIKATLKTYFDALYPSGSGTSTGTNTGDQTSVTGNAGTATALQTARALNGVNFDGTAAIVVPIPLARTAVKTTSYSAAAGDIVPVDTTSGAVTITLPSAPADKTLVAIKHIIQGGTNAVTYQCGGSDVFNKAGGATSGTLVLLAQGVLLSYNAATSIWTIISTDTPLSQLDLRFQPLDADLTAIAGLTSAADKLPYFTGAAAAAVADFTSVARTLVAQTTQATLRTAGLGSTTVGDALFVAADAYTARAAIGVGIGRQLALRNNLAMS